MDRADADPNDCRGLYDEIATLRQELEAARAEADRAGRDRDSLARRCAVRLAEREEARAEARQMRVNRPGAPRPFALWRDEGVVALGAQWPDGTAVLRWTSDGWPTLAVHERGIESVEAVHGQGVAARVVWLGDEAARARGRWPRVGCACDIHGRSCEPPSELCCERCSETQHPYHADGSTCSAPDLSGNGMPTAVEVALRDEVARVTAERDSMRLVVGEAVRLCADWAAGRSTHGGGLVAAVDAYQEQREGGRG